MKKQKRNITLLNKEERGQTAIIVTILLILVSIAGVVVISTWVIPMIKNSLSEGNLKADLSIDRDGTFYNPNVLSDCGGITDCLKNPRTYVKVTRGSTGVGELYAIKFIFHLGDQSLIYMNTNVPAPIESRTYSFYLVGENKTDSVEIAPVMLVDGNQRNLQVLDSISIRTDSMVVPLNKLERCSQPMNSNSGNFPSDPDASCLIR